jgi:hypothetical protein
MIEWLVKHVGKLEAAFKKPLSEVNAKLRSNKDFMSSDIAQDDSV